MPALLSVMACMRTSLASERNSRSRVRAGRAMPSPQIQAYLEARDECIEAGQNRPDPALSQWSDKQWAAEQRFHAVLRRRVEALVAIAPGLTYESVLRALEDPCAWEPYVWAGLEDPHVYRVMLIEEFGGDRVAADSAWALGQRPTGYPGQRA